MNTNKQILFDISRQLQASTKTSWTSGGITEWSEWGKKMRTTIETVVPIINSIAEGQEEKAAPVPVKEPIINFIYDAQKALGNLQDNTIGLFRIYGTTQLALVVEVERDLLKVVSVSQLAAISTIHIPANKGKLHLFKEGVTLGSIKYDAPFELAEITENLKKD